MRKTCGVGEDLMVDRPHVSGGADGCFWGARSEDAANEDARPQREGIHDVPREILLLRHSCACPPWPVIRISDKATA